MRFSAADSALSLTLLQMRDNKRTECFSHKRERESFFARCIVMEIEAKLLACTRARRYAVLRFFLRESIYVYVGGHRGPEFSTCHSNPNTCRGMYSFRELKKKNWLGWDSHVPTAYIYVYYI